MGEEGHGTSEARVISPTGKGRDASSEGSASTISKTLTERVLKAIERLEGTPEQHIKQQMTKEERQEIARCLQHVKTRRAEMREGDKEITRLRKETRRILNKMRAA